MEDFSLINAINKYHQKEPDKIDYGIQYQQYEINVDGTDIAINIPLRESENFERFMGELGTSKISKNNLKQLLRQFRGTHVGDE